MLEYNQKPFTEIKFQDTKIQSFVNENDEHVDVKTVKSFGEEWKKFDSFDDAEIKNIGNEYFDIVDEKILNKDAVVLDLGCGSGRWSRYMADRVKFVEAVDPSDAVMSAAKLNLDKSNIRVTQAGIDNIPFADESFDFIICLGVMHHLPQTAEALAKATLKLKRKGYFLLYLYYKLDNRGAIYKLLFKLSGSIRYLVSKLPSTIKKFICELIAIFIYMPLIFISRFVKLIFSKKNYYKYFPLSYYINKSFKVVRNDALDRFGTPLEQRFSKNEIESMMKKAGFTEIHFSDNEPYWHVLGKRA
ncbi:MAG: class I SAM-dependent methyltransferase [Bacteroidia bacterium]